MTNYLKMPKKQQVLALLALDWSYRRIEAETGVRRETVSGYDRQRRANPAKTFTGSDRVPVVDTPGLLIDDGSNPAITFPGSPPYPAKTFLGSRRFTARSYATLITEKLDAGLTMQRVWQDLVEEVGYGASYQSVKRFVHSLGRRARPVGVFLSGPGDEGQIDFFRGAPTLDTPTGQWKRPWVFRLTLCHSRHGYEEAVWDQRLETFLRLHERAFRDIGGVPRVVRHDNLKVGVSRACFFDPDIQRVYEAFSHHWGFTALPIQPRRPGQNGKQERSGGYVKSNGLKGRRFDSLADQNAFLRHWNRTIARLRIHGTTRRQVWTHFLEIEQPALLPLATEAFPYYTSGARTVHPDGHIEVDGAFYPVPLHLLGQAVRADWDTHLVRVYHVDTLVTVQARVPPGQYAPSPGQTGTDAASRQQAFVQKLLGRCERVGPPLRAWAEAAIVARGVRAIRLIQGVVGLTRRLPREHVLHAATTALQYQRFRYKDLVRLATPAVAAPTPPLRQADDSIRPLTQYRLEDFL